MTRTTDPETSDEATPRHGVAFESLVSAIPDPFRLGDLRSALESLGLDMPQAAEEAERLRRVWQRLTIIVRDEKGITFWRFAR